MAPCASLLPVFLQRAEYIVDRNAPEFGSFAVPIFGQFNVASNTDSANLIKNGRIIGLRHREGSLGIAMRGEFLEQQSRIDNIAVAELSLALAQQFLVFRL